MANLEMLPWYPGAEPDFRQLRRALLREGAPDYVPLYELYANVETIRAICGDADLGTAFWRYYAWAGYDYVPVWPDYDMPLGDLVDTSKPYPIKDLDGLRSYPWPDPASIRYDQFEAVYREMPEGMRAIGQTGGPFEMAQQLLSYESLCYMLYDEPELLDELFTRIGDLYEALYAGMAAQPGVGALVISDDMGYKCGTMISSEHLRHYVKPIHTRIAAIAHAADLPCILHSCGKLDDIMDEWIRDVKIDAKHSFEDGIRPVEDVFAQYRDRIAILGGYDLNRLCVDSPADVYTRSARLVTMGRRGGYALGSGNSIPHFVPHENYAAMLRANRDARQ